MELSVLILAGVTFVLFAIPISMNLGDENEKK